MEIYVNDSEARSGAQVVRKCFHGPQKHSSGCEVPLLSAIIALSIEIPLENHVAT